MPRDEFLTLKGNPIIEKYKFKQSIMNNALDKLSKGLSLTESLPNLHPRYMNNYYNNIKKYQLENDMNIKLGDTYMKEAIEKHDTLNPNLWDDNNELLPEVRETLNLIVDKFNDNLKDDGIDLDILDVVIIGSNASYNYNPTSDIDLHIIADTSIYEDEDLALKAYQAYKSLFNNRYDPMIRDSEVEIYVEPYEVRANSKGIYSLNTGWLKEPEQTEIPEIDQQTIEDYLAPFKEKFDDVMTAGSIEDVNELINDIYLERQRSIITDGEFAIPNLAFKEFRAQGYLQKLRDRKVELENDSMSLSLDDKVNENIENLFIEKTIDESYLPTEIKEKEVYKNRHGDKVEIIKIEPDAITYVYNPIYGNSYSAKDPYESFIYMLNDFNFERIDEELEEIGNGIEFRFPEIRDTLDVFLN